MGSRSASDQPRATEQAAAWAQQVGRADVAWLPVDVSVDVVEKLPDDRVPGAGQSTGTGGTRVGQAGVRWRRRWWQQRADLDRCLELVEEQAGHGPAAVEPHPGEVDLSGTTEVGHATRVEGHAAHLAGTGQRVPLVVDQLTGREGAVIEAEDCFGRRVVGNPEL